MAQYHILNLALVLAKFGVAHLEQDTVQFFCDKDITWREFFAHNPTYFPSDPSLLTSANPKFKLATYVVLNLAPSTSKQYCKYHADIMQRYIDMYAQGGIAA